VSDLKELKARVGGLTYRREPDDPDLLEARAELRAARLDAYINRLLASTPSLTDAERQHLAKLLTA
jgi:hypothetical protein